jgi:hypothetical protein
MRACAHRSSATAARSLTPPRARSRPAPAAPVPRAVDLGRADAPRVRSRCPACPRCGGRLRVIAPLAGSPRRAGPPRPPGPLRHPRAARPAPPAPAALTSPAAQSFGCAHWPARGSSARPCPPAAAPLGPAAAPLRPLLDRAPVAAQDGLGQTFTSWTPTMSLGLKSSNSSSTR